MSCIFILLYRYKQCQQQVGSSDCGLYAVAFAAQSWLLEVIPVHLNSTSNLCANIFTILFKQVYSHPFPLRELEGEIERSHVLVTNIKIFCYCRMPETMSKRMIRCDKCLNWFHLELCVVEAEIISEKWFCRHCT